MGYEYADIEIISNELNTSLPNFEVKSVDLSQEYMKRMRPEGDFRKLKGFTFIGVERIGKALIFNLQNNYETICFGNRLGKSAGWLLLAGTGMGDSCEATLHLKSPSMECFLVYRDPSKSGKVEIREHRHEVESVRIYGPEIKSSQFTIDWVEFFCGRHQMPIFELLMEPRYLPGVEKQLSSEILFRANINPAKPSWSLTRTQIKRLFKAIHTVINGHITAKGSGLDSELCVYKREGDSCYVCQSIIRREKVKKRFGYYCFNCQSDDWTPPKPIAEEFVSLVIESMGDEIECEKRR